MICRFLITPSRDLDSHMEAGHAPQNVLLQATAMGLGSVPIGAFQDDRVAELHQLAPDHIPLYLLPIGYT